MKKSLIGLGYHGTITPPVIQRNVLENPGWYTAYTPYQAEIAQGRLEALLNFQTMIAELTGMEIANASLLDEATAAAEAVAMAHALQQGGQQGDRRGGGCASADPRRASPPAPGRWAGRSWISHPGDIEAIAGAKPFAVVLNIPAARASCATSRAEIARGEDLRGAGHRLRGHLLALTHAHPAGRDGRGYRGGLRAALRRADGLRRPACRVSSPPGMRSSAPCRGVWSASPWMPPARPAMRLALQTREQHIRREKATSNICTAQVLLAVMAGFYAAWHGPEGLKAIARRVNLQARLLADAARQGGYTLRHDQFFDTLAIEAGTRADELMQAELEAGFNFRRIDATGVGIALDETVTRAELEALAAVLGGRLDAAPESVPAALRRNSAFCEAAVFNTHRSEHSMLRYLKRLEDKDIALNRSMIPLGSCTMKLNAAVEMAAITWPEFAEIHPFAPANQTEGFKALIDELAALLAEVTGFAGVSLQPNSGAQGEYAGLLAIRAFHEARGQGQRNICLIPASAHGTNPASAAMAGYKVVVVACDKTRQRRCRRSGSKNRRARAEPGGADDHLPEHAWRVRDLHPRHLPRGA